MGGGGQYAATRTLNHAAATRRGFRFDLVSPTKQHATDG